MRFFLLALASITFLGCGIEQSHSGLKGDVTEDSTVGLIRQAFLNGSDVTSDLNIATARCINHDSRQEIWYSEFLLMTFQGLNGQIILTEFQKGVVERLGKDRHGSAIVFGQSFRSTKFTADLYGSMHAELRQTSGANEQRILVAEFWHETLQTGTPAISGDGYAFSYLICE
mgnify:CR=1 FL=1